MLDFTDWSEDDFAGNPTHGKGGIMSEYTLDFLEAVKALHEGRCEGIENEAGGQYRLSGIGAIVYTVKWSDKKNACPFPRNVLGKWKLIGVKKRTEERTIKYWLVVYNNGRTDLWSINPHLPDDTIQQIIPLSHTYTYTFPE